MKRLTTIIRILLYAVPLFVGIAVGAMVIEIGLWQQFSPIYGSGGMNNLGEAFIALFVMTGLAILIALSLTAYLVLKIEKRKQTRR